MLQKFVDTLQTHQDGILANYDYLVFEGFLNIPCLYRIFYGAAKMLD